MMSTSQQLEEEEYELLPKTPPPEPPETSSENIPQSDTISFETGNPETGTVIRGTLDVTTKPTTSIMSTVGPMVPPCIVVVESVPGLMTSADICHFVRPFLDSIMHLRTLRSCSERNRYIVVIKFESATHAHDFKQQCQGKYYLRGLVQETCVIRTVEAIRFQTTETANNGGPSGELRVGFPEAAMFPPDSHDAVSNGLSNCSVCLDVLDESASALVTIFCNHTLHAACLAESDVNRCPVCRHTHELKPEATVCIKCGKSEDLWMCIVCAFVGCGESSKKHALEHFSKSLHPFASNLSDRTYWTGDIVRAGSVWDYISERFVNRLVTSEDGKVVEVDNDGNASNAAGSSSNTNGGGGRSDSCCASSGVSPVLEGNDDMNDRAFQAAIYASGMDAVVDQHRIRLEQAEAEHASEKEQLNKQIENLQQQVLSHAKERKSLVKKLSESEKEMKTLRDKNGFLKSLNEMLLRDKQAWNEELERMKVTVAQEQQTNKNLEDQLRDLMLHLETQSTIAGNGGDGSNSNGDGGGGGSTSAEPCRSDVSELHGADVVRVGPSRRERLAMKTNRRFSGS